MYNDSCFQYHCVWQNLQASYSFIAKLTHHSQLLIFWFWFLSKKFSAWSNRGMGFVQLDWSDWVFGVAIREWQAFNGWDIIRVCFVFFSFVFIISFTSWPEDQFVKWSISLVATTVLIFLFFLYTLYTLIHLCAHRHNRHYSFCTTPKKFFCSYFCCDNDQKTFSSVEIPMYIDGGVADLQFCKGSISNTVLPKILYAKGESLVPQKSANENSVKKRVFLVQKHHFSPLNLFLALFGPF